MQWLSMCLAEINARPVYRRPNVPVRGIVQERDLMHPLPTLEYENCDLKRATTSRYSLVKCEGNFYSVPDTYRSRLITLKIMVDRIGAGGQFWTGENNEKRRKTVLRGLHPDQSGCQQSAFCFATKADELEVAFEQLVNEIDHNCEERQSAQKPHGFPEESNDYDCKNQQKQVLNTSLDSHALNDVIFQ